MDPFIEEMYKGNPEEYADYIKVNIPNRVEVYMDSNYDNI